jgi:hypothetical protein
MSDKRQVIQEKKPRVVLFDTDNNYRDWADHVRGNMSNYTQEGRIEHLLWICLRFLFFLACRPGHRR